MKGKAFEMRSYEWNKALKVFAWSMASALVTLALAFMANAQLPAQYAVFVPIVNTILYGVSQYIKDNQAAE